jgi:hypothetical protein
MQRTQPPFRADHVGSLLRPAALKKARERRANGEIAADALKEVEDREIGAIIAKQEEAGLQSITDGEFRRSWWHLDFLWGLDGVERHQMNSGIAFAAVTTRNEGVRVSGKLGFSGHPMLEHFKFLKEHTQRTPKMTIPAPSALYGRPVATPIDKGYIRSSTCSSTTSARPTRRRCAPSTMPAAATCSSTKCSSPCCATRNTASRCGTAATIPTISARYTATSSTPRSRMRRPT